MDDSSYNDSSYTSDSSLFLWRGYASPPVEITIQITLWSIAVITVLGNVLVLIVFARDPLLRARISNLFILNLAVADLFVGLISIPFYNLYRETGLWRYGEGVCKFWIVMDFTETYVSVYAIVFISYDRYVLITKGLEYDKVQTFRKFIVLSALNWLINFLRLFIAIVVYEMFVESIENYDFHCGGTALYKRSFIIYDIITSNLIPVALIIFFNTKVYMDIKRRSRGLPRNQIEPDRSTLETSVNEESTSSGGNPQSESGNQATIRRQGTNDIRKHRRAAITLGLLVGVSWLCWIPYFIVSFLPVSFGITISPRVHIAAVYIFYVNSTVNPLLYVATNPRIRNGILKLFRKLRK